MKKFLFLIAALSLWTWTLSAQIVPGIQYSDLKYIYNEKDYKGNSDDAYSPALAGIGSFFIPGLGQFCCGEKGRGLGLFAGSLAIDGAMFFSGAQLVYYFNRDENGLVKLDEDGQLFTDPKEAERWSTYFGGFMIVGIVYGVICCIDAVKVAKVRNLYLRDLKGITSTGIELYPSLDIVQGSAGAEAVTGLTLSMKF